jgi:lambda repressor-like predicted transcriptional regulator
VRGLAVAAVKGYLLGQRGVEMRKLDSKERLLVERLNQVLEDSHPTTEELAITLEITPEDILERFPDRVYDLREKIVDATMIFGDTNEEDPDGWYEDDSDGEEEET